MVDLGPIYAVGGFFSLCASVFVMYSYIKFKTVRQHPSSLIFYRSCVDVIFAVHLIILWLWEGADSWCSIFSLVFQFCVLASQLYYAMLAYDLWNALRNPFVAPATYLPQYHAIVWVLSLASIFVVWMSDSTSFRGGLQVCWIKPTTDLGDVNLLNWILFFIPTLCCYFFSIGVLVYAHSRLSKGLAETFKIRSQILENGQRYVAAFTVYWTCASILYFLIYLEEREGKPEADTSPVLYGAFALVLSLRSLVDIAVWGINQHVFQTYQRYMANAPQQDLALTDINRALRKEVLQYSTQGICEGIDTAAGHVTLTKVLPLHFPTSLFMERDAHRAIECYQLVRDDTEQPTAVPFYDYCPQVFKFLRANMGIVELEYRKSISGETAQMIEKYTEGASGSFFYFSADSQYIVKTLTLSEATFLVEDFLPHYVRYMSTHPDSLISKFLGFHSIKLYNLTLYFVVMRSVFLTDIRIHQRFDLKGSWVNRHAKKQKGGGGVLKDNDLNHKLSLSSRQRHELLQIVTQDANFLQQLNIMDYSMLLGIHHIRQLVVTDEHPPVDEKKEETQQQRLSIVSGTGGVDDVMVPFYMHHHGGIQARVLAGPGVYFFGIIDILQTYSFTKKAERFLKIVFKCVDGAGLSSIDPEPYSRRFIEQMYEITADEFADEDQATDMRRISQETLNTIEMASRGSFSVSKLAEMQSKLRQSSSMYSPQ